MINAVVLSLFCNQPATFHTKMKSIAICAVIIVIFGQQNFAQSIPLQMRYVPVVPVLPTGVRGNAVGNAGIKPGAAPVVTRPLQGVGAYTFGGAASGRPSFGPSFAFNNGAGGGGGGGLRPQATLNSPQAVKPQQNQVFRGNGGGPQRPLTYSYN